MIHPRNLPDWLPFLVAVVLSCFSVMHPLFDYDIYWHLAFGREMWATGEIVQHEPFSHTAANTPFVNRYWLAQLIFFALQQLIGWPGLVIFKLLVVAGIAVLMVRTALLLGAGRWVAALVVPLGLLSVHYRFTERPELFSLLFLAWLAFVLTGWQTRHLSARWLWTLPPLMLVWDWVHGAVYGLTYLLLFVALENIRSHLAASNRTPVPKALNAAVLVTLLVMVVNPWGLLTYGEFVGHLTGSSANGTLSTRIAEYYPTNWREWKGLVLVLLSWVGLSLLRRREVYWPQTLIALAFALLAMQINRLAGVAMILVAPLLAAVLSSALRMANWQKPLGLLITGVLVITFLGTAYVEKLRKPGTPRSFGIGVAELYFPVGGARFVKATGIDGKMFNSGHLGGYLAWTLYPPRKVYHYNNGNLFGDTYRHWHEAMPAFLNEVDYAFLANRRDYELFSEAGWATVYRDPVIKLVVRRTPGNAALIEKFALRVFHPLMETSHLDEIPETSLPRLLDEMAVYLAFRNDARVAQEFRRLAAKYPQALFAMTLGGYLPEACQRHPELRGSAFLCPN